MSFIFPFPFTGSHKFFLTSCARNQPIGHHSVGGPGSTVFGRRAGGIHQKGLPLRLVTVRAPTPVTQESVTLFVAYLGAEGLAVSTIESYLAALRYFRILADHSCTLPSFYTPHMKLLLRGVQRLQASPSSAR